ncbi:MAG: NAD(P)H-dependent oxidoreductase subunit E [Bacilli bacterium]|jgi:NADH:ubiquinone oxidoreductase subunit E|nr:NAD(P)H-dependent oxidoreductase subunit E [Bacilli bacterium]
METEKMPPELKAKYDELDAFIKEKNCNEHELIAILHKAQGLFGYLPPEVQRFIAKRIHVPVSKVYGVVTFYSFFTMKKEGKYVIRVCLGTACFVRGSEKILNEFISKLKVQPGETTPDGLYTLETVRCIGACGLAPVIDVNGKVFGASTIDTVNQILEEYK